MKPQQSQTTKNRINATNIMDNLLRDQLPELSITDRRELAKNLYSALRENELTIITMGEKR